MKLFLGFADFCPFNEDMIDDINRCLLPLVHSNEQAIVPDISSFIAYHSGGGRNKPASFSQPNICTHVIHSRKTEWLTGILLSGFFLKLICMLIGIISDKRNA